MREGARLRFRRGRGRGRRRLDQRVIDHLPARFSFPIATAITDLSLGTEYHDLCPPSPAAERFPDPFQARGEASEPCGFRVRERVSRDRGSDRRPRGIVRGRQRERRRVRRCARQQVGFRRWVDVRVRLERRWVGSAPWVASTHRSRVVAVPACLRLRLRLRLRRAASRAGALQLFHAAGH